MHLIRSKLLKWFLRVLGTGLVLFCVYVCILANPQFMFPFEYRIGKITFYADSEINDELMTVAEDVADQVRNTEVFDPAHETEIFLCHDQSTYNIFARMTLVGTHIPGYNLSVLTNSFVSIPRIAEMSLMGKNAPQYSVFEGELCHGISHEVIHDYMVKKIGFFSNRRLPTWKREGYAEYKASLNRLRLDTDQSLIDRVKQIEENTYWSAHVVEYFSWRTVTEYLFEIENCSLGNFLVEDLTYEDAQRNMLAWYNSKLLNLGE